jgi:uncharacterized protein YyaL (SSP411 family)
MESAEKTNRLIGEKSPYLLQHAHNPVDWYPWGEEAFARAKAEDKPVFLSIGYSACHWCHVMERESFADEEVARLMNETFVSIKVDREERPDLDHHWMAVCQMLTGGGGWPLTLILTPDKAPLFAGTYFPKQTRHNRIGLLELIPKIQSLWKANRAGAVTSAEKVRASFAQISSAPAPGPIAPDISGRAFEQFRAQFDARWGGFGPAPKFPAPHNVFFLLRWAARTGSRQALDMVLTTLRALRRGGIWDHLGFGFHRYSTDVRWLVPHFEKMLYDQALLTMAYLEAYQAAAEPDLGRTARETLTYVLGEMASPEGLFYAGEDADTEGVEGKYYLWTEAEITKSLEPEEADLATLVFGVNPNGNFKGAEGEGAGRSILHLANSLDRIAADLKLGEEDLRERVERIRVKLLAARRLRPAPLKDTKILTDWNGLMIAALAAAGRTLEDGEAFAAAGRRAAEALLAAARGKDGRLIHRRVDDRAGIPGFLDDYAFLAWGLIELYETLFEPEYLATAVELVDTARARFADEKTGGFFYTADDATELPPRLKVVHDGALPSGNSVMVMNLARLARLTGRVEFEDWGLAAARAFAQEVNRSPASFAQMLCGLEFAAGPSHEVVIAGDPGAEAGRELVRAVRRGYWPNAVVLSRPAGESAEILRIAPFTKSMTPLDGKPAVYVCTGFRCLQPTTDPARVPSLLGGEV